MLVIGIVAVIGAFVSFGLVRSEVLGAILAVIVGSVVILSGMLGILYKIVHDGVSDAVN